MNENINQLIAFILKRHSEELTEQWLKYSPVDNNGNYEEDIHKVNRFLRIQLGLLPIDTTYQREVLVSTDSLHDWLVNFENEIVPLIKSHGLPIWN